ncbi:MAG: hypothetical protein ACPLRU_02440 [Desulfofundulus sp.]
MAALPLVFLLFVVLVWVTRTAQDVSSADVVLKNSVGIAVKAAANQFDRESLQIDFRRARRAFEKMLQENLELKGDLEPQKYSAFSGRPAYTLVVYDGQASEGRPAGVQYTYGDGKLTEAEIPGGGFPRAFVLPGGVKVTLQSPGAVAELSVSSKKVFGGEVVYRRWAAARIVQRDQEWIVVLVGKD